MAERAPAARAPRLAGHPRRDRLDGDGHRRHADGRPARAGSHRRRRPRRHPVLRPGRLRHGPPARPRHRRLAGLRRRRSRRLPALAVAGAVARAVRRGAARRPAVAAARLARSLRRQPGHHRRRPRQPRRAVADAAAAVRLRRVAALPAGDRPGAAGDVRARRRQRRQRDRQLGADLRAPRACPRSAPTAPPGRRVGGADRDGDRAARRDRLARPAAPSRDAGVARPRAARSRRRSRRCCASACRRCCRWCSRSASSRWRPRWRPARRPTAIAAHQVSLELAGLAFMVPLGIASAAAVRVGHAVGRARRPGRGARRLGRDPDGHGGDGDHGARSSCCCRGS